ncbi:MAG TPA: glycine/sarcosine/betaine reductase component B subunit, partial [Candidatus Binatia bacterium]|nr:glycine/sarcosine/betaine reductase component B subunit [Candidatus Binatia bacterium]
MQLTLANHPLTELRFGTPTRLDGTTLLIDAEELRRLVAEEEAIENVEFEIVRPGESCRAGPIFDIVQPRAKEPGSSPDFPGILGQPITAGVGITHVLEGVAVSVLAERSPGESRSVTGRILEMSGIAAEATVYSSLQHLIVIPHTRAGLPIHVTDKAYRRAGLQSAVYLGRAALNEAPASTHTFDPVGPGEREREGL